MFNVRLAGGHLYGKQLFTWLSLVVSLMASFVLSFFQLDALDEILDLVESVSEGFLTYSRYITIFFINYESTTGQHDLSPVFFLLRFSRLRSNIFLRRTTAYQCYTDNPPLTSEI